MLNRFRNAMRGVVAWVIGVLIILAMAVVGVPALENFGGTAALSVGKTEYSARDLELELRRQVQAIQAENPNVSRTQILEAGITQQILQNLVARALIENEADRLGLAAPNEVIRTYIENIDALRNPETGEFDSDLLRLALQQQGTSLTDFSRLISSELKRQQVAEALTAEAPAPGELTRLILLRQFETRDLAVGTLPIEAAAGDPDEDALRAYYDEHIANYQSPEYRTFTVLTITEEDVAEEVEVSEEDLQQLFEARQGGLAAAETRSFRQLRVTGDEAVAEAEALASEGAGLEAIADATGAEVTALNDQSRGAIINEGLAEAVFDAEEGALVGPITTPFGTLFAEVTTVNAAEGASFEDSREELEAELRSELAAGRLVELVEGVELARDEGASLSEAAQSIGLQATTTQPVDAELFTRTGSIANVPAVLNAEGLRLGEGEESTALRLDDGYGFISVDRVEPPQPLPFEEVRPSVEQAWRAEAVANAANELEARFAALQAEGMGFDEAVQELGGTVETATVSLQDEESALPNEALAEAYQLQVGKVGAVAAQSEPVVYVVKVNDVQYTDSSAIAGVVPALSQQFGEQLSGELNQAYLEGLRADATIRQNERQLARAFGTDQQ